MDGGVIKERRVKGIRSKENRKLQKKNINRP